MTNEIATQNKTTLLYGQSLPPQERSEHRAWIGVRVDALLDGYWQTRPNEMARAEIMADWMASLEAFTREEIRAACREWLNNCPDRKPRAGHIRALVLGARSRSKQSRPRPMSRDEREAYQASVARDRISQERANQAEKIMAEVLGRTATQQGETEGERQ